MHALSKRWLATGGAVVLAALVGVALLLRDGGAACAAARAGDKATFYELGGGTGNCSFPSAPADDLFVALGAADYDGGAACGSYLDVKGPKGKVRVKVIDSCPPCAAGHIDLSRTAFKRIADEVDGIVPITYTTVRAPKVPGPVSVRLKEGSSRFWFAALIDNHGDRLRSVKVNGKTATRTDFNYWIIDGGAGAGPFKITFTDAYGRSTTVPGIKLKPGVTQKAASAILEKKKPKPAVSSAAPATKAPPPSPAPAPSAPPAPSTSASETAPPAVALVARPAAC
ncbi:expansin EXLX1 family cellulose-binding protein [Actinoplanes sp. NPDC049265]|uniref:expansin EXLX1 family cellulose-binding protein n=1 Tax=Actinoplanes sp. NPDC049265 TaxID=3363902 RepID=UPI00372364F9